MLRPKCFLVALVFIPFCLFGQDPFFTHFYGNEALFNPALTGNRGALSINLKAKQQWGSSGIDGYETYQLVFEESVPCSFFDYGFSLLQDMEGAGRLQTQQFGGMLAAPLRLTSGLSKNIIQFRIGIGVHWGRQSVDFGELLFIDQLHPKYGLTDPDGNPISSAFIAPNDGVSSWYFQPSGGLSLRYIINPQSRYASNINVGFAMHNLVPWNGEDGRGHSWSLLGLGTPTVPRFTYFLQWEKVLGYVGQSFVSIKPQFFAQSQRGIAYLEGGIDASFSRQFILGFFLHSSRPNEGQSSTNWGSVHLETGFFTGPNSRLDIGFGYAYNFSGLRNFVNNTYELTLRFSFASSPMCNLAQQPIKYGKARALPCPTLRQGAGRNKIYENIWYRNQ